MAKFSVSNICYCSGQANEVLADKGKAFQRKRRKAMGLRVEYTYDCQVAGGFRRRLKLPVSFVVSITCLQPGGR